MRTCSNPVIENVKIRKKVHLFPGIILRFVGFIFAVSEGPNALFAAESQTTPAISIRTLSSPYQLMYKVGAETYAKKVGLPLDVLLTEANSQKGLSDIKSEVARTSGRCEGLQQVLSKNPGIQLLQWESAQWDRVQAYNVTRQCW
jgi:ABC-type sugar transport system substrate-binding protein